MNLRSPSWPWSSAACACLLTGFSALAQPTVAAVLIPQGGNFQVNTVPLPIDFAETGVATPVAAVSPNGSFVVAWAATEATDAGSNIHARRFAADGTPLGGEFVANSTPAGANSAKESPVIAIDGSGDFVIGWADHDPALDTPSEAGYNFKGRAFLADGTPRGGDFCIDTNCPTAATGDAAYGGLSLAMDDAGDVVASWVDVTDGFYGIDASGNVEVRRFSADGTPKDAQPITVIGGLGFYTRPVVAANRSTGDFAVAALNDYFTYPDLYTEEEHSSLYVWRYQASGALSRASVKMASCTATIRAVIFGCMIAPDPVIASDGAGNLTVLWQQGSQGTARSYAERLRSNSSLPGFRFQLEKHSRYADTLEQLGAAADKSGNLLAAWNLVAASGGSTVLAQAVASNNQLQGAPVSVAPDGSYASRSAVAMNEDGNAVVVWIDQYCCNPSLQVQRYLLSP